MDGTQASAESYGYQIKGTNPTKAQVFAIASSLEAKGVFWQESKHKQFGTVTYPTPYTGTGYPLTYQNSDWGIAQIHFYDNSNDRLVWNWYLNASTGISMLNDCYAKAQQYFDYWYHIDQIKGDTWPWDPHTQTSRVWDDAIARYKTGDPIYSPNGNKGVENCTWSEKAQAGCTYKNSVRNYMTTQPWTQY
jgi:hypothetical protein